MTVRRTRADGSRRQGRRRSVFQVQSGGMLGRSRDPVDGVRFVPDSVIHPPEQVSVDPFQVVGDPFQGRNLPFVELRVDLFLAESSWSLGPVRQPGRGQAPDDLYRRAVVAVALSEPGAQHVRARPGFGVTRAGAAEVARHPRIGDLGFQGRQPVP